MAHESHFERLLTLAHGAATPPPGLARIALALSFGIVVLSVFAIAVTAMIAAMYFGMSRSVGNVAWPYAILANAALIIQFPLVHSLLLTGPGGGWLARIVPGQHGSTLSTTTYALIASIQLLALFAFCTPRGIIWWLAEGAGLYLLSTLYASTWLLLRKASWDAGAEVQSGALGWMSLMQNKRPRFPDMPTSGLFRIIRQPIYLSFALTLWAVPTWTPDQLALAVSLTSYCLFAPLLKERRFKKRYGERFEAYKESVPYMIPQARAQRRNCH